ncbi:unnamed protein product [Lupinus luteus]|uniref:Uncharacterized protein n=1 Tax=Lupinus luteus TaxID=3873 RepID=A0AAV1XW82_LUPLU
MFSARPSNSSLPLANSDGSGRGWKENSVVIWLPRRLLPRQSPMRILGSHPTRQIPAIKSIGSLARNFSRDFPHNLGHLVVVLDN